MRNVVISAATLVVAAMLVVACTGTTEVRVDAGNDGGTVEVAQGADLVVALEGNPTTGFDWVVVGTLPPQLTAKGDTLESSAAPGAVGAGGTRAFTFAGVAPGTGVLKMEYRRSWETTVPPLQTYTLNVVVK